MKYIRVNVGRGFYYTTEKTPIRKYGGRKSNEQKEKDKGSKHLKIKKGLFVIHFD
jgi:hypothetical protein